jgi:thiamine kinase-like enzyme
MNNKEKWTELTGGISNKIYLYDNKYVIKVINKDNNNLFVIFENYYTILKSLDTTLYIDEPNSIIIEKYIEGNIITNDILFSTDFCIKIFDYIDNQIHTQKPEIHKYNCILKYIEYLQNYLSKNNLYTNEVSSINLLVKDKFELLYNDNDLVFSHNDVHKHNIIISNDDQINLIDFEYSGYTWKYFDHCNFIVLLANEIIMDKNIGIIQYDFFDLYISIMVNKYELNKEYISSLMLTALYTWYLWALVKTHINSNTMYYRYSKQMLLCITSICQDNQTMHCNRT